MHHFLMASAFIGVALSACVDGVNNVVTLADAPSGANIAQFKDVKVQTYDKFNRPFCENSVGAVHLPGSLKLVSVSDIHMGIQGFHDIKIMKENSKFDLCKEIGADICALISTPGVHSLDQMESKGLNNTIVLSAMTGLIRNVVKGYWTSTMNVMVSGVPIASILVPYNENWLYIDAESS